VIYVQPENIFVALRSMVKSHRYLDEKGRWEEYQNDEIVWKRYREKRRGKL